jgi:hypothetical protein
MSNIFEKEAITQEELFEILKESMETTNMIKKHLPMRLYNMAKETYERNEQVSSILKKLYERDRSKVKDVLIIDSKTAIINTYDELFSEPEKDWYQIYFDGKMHYEYVDNFQKALILAVCTQQGYDGNSDAPELISKMLEIE